MDIEHLKKQIKSRAVEKNLSITTLERNAGLKRSAISNILLGRSKKPNINCIKAIADVLNCDPQELTNSNYINRFDTLIIKRLNKFPADTTKFKEIVWFLHYEILSLNLQFQCLKELVVLILNIYEYVVLNKIEASAEIVRYYAKNFKNK